MSTKGVQRNQFWGVLAPGLIPAEEIMHQMRNLFTNSQRDMTVKKYGSESKKKTFRSFINNQWSILHSTNKEKKKRRTRTSCWMKEWLIERDSLSAYNTIFKELHLNDQEYFRRYLRMNTRNIRGKMKQL